MVSCKFREGGKVEHIVSFLSVKNSTNLSAKSLEGFIKGRILAGSLCKTSPRTRNILGGCGDYL